MDGENDAALHEHGVLSEELAHSRMLTRIGGRVARVGGWSIDLPSWEVRWSEELFTILEIDGSAALGLEDGYALYREPERIQALLQRCADDGTPFEVELDAVTVTGRPLRARVAGEPQRDERGAVVRIVGAFQDITTQHEVARRASALARRLESTFESMTDALYLLDEQWRFAYVNAHAERLLARDREEILGVVVWEAFPETVNSALEHAYRRAVGTRETQSLEGWYYPPLDIWFDVTAYPSEQGLAVYFRDAGERVHRVQRLERIAREEQAAAEQLREASQLKDTFLAAVSHELRTPLTVVQGMGRTLQRLGADLSPERRSELEDALVDHADRLGKLLDDLLDLDRLSRGERAARPERCDAAALVREVVSELLGDTTTAAAALTDVPEQLEARVDPTQLQRIAHNLVDNARKYAPPGPSRISLRPLPPDGVVLEVADEGPGIDDELRDRVFEPLFRADEDHPKPGTGIGLALVAAFAGLHGGGAEVVDTPTGACLRVTLPGS